MPDWPCPANGRFCVDLLVVYVSSLSESKLWNSILIIDGRTWAGGKKTGSAAHAQRNAAEAQLVSVSAVPSAWPASRFEFVLVRRKTRCERIEIVLSCLVLSPCFVSSRCQFQLCSVGSVVDPASRWSFFFSHRDRFQFVSRIENSSSFADGSELPGRRCVSISEFISRIKGSLPYVVSHFSRCRSSWCWWNVRVESVFLCRF